MTTRSPADDPETLEARAAAAEQSAADLDRRAAAGEDIDLAEYDRHVEDARRLRWAARSARKRREQQAGNERAAQLADLHADVLAVADDASGPAEAIAGQLAVIGRAAAEAKRLGADHDSIVRGLAGRARTLGVAAVTAPSGEIPAANGGVALTGNGVRAGHAQLRQLGDIGALIADAAAGREVTVPPLVTISSAEPPPVPAHAVLGAGGMIHGFAELTENQRALIANGSLVELTPDERAAWWDGQPVDIDFRARADAQVTAAKAAEKQRLAGLRAAQMERIRQNETAARERAAELAGR